MSIEHRMRQGAEQVVDVRDWDPDDEFPIGPQGRKPKSILICPTPAPWPFLLAGHRYLFKQPAGTKVQQIWSEIIAYELARDRGIEVPPAFAALNSRDGSPGVLIEFFYGYRTDVSTSRFVHAIEIFQGQGVPLDERVGSLRDNMTLSRSLKVADWRSWWPRTVAFDALIGNTDRHSENWGFLVQQPEGADRPTYVLAPAFDNGTSLGHIIRDEDLSKYRSEDALTAFIGRGRHHFGWTSGDGLRQHVDLCAHFSQVRFGTREMMTDVIHLADKRIVEVAKWCTGFDFPVAFTKARAEFVIDQVIARRDALIQALGV